MSRASTTRTRISLRAGSSAALRYVHSRKAVCLLVGLLALMSGVPAGAQQAVAKKLLQKPAPTEVPASEWRAPDVVNLDVHWWDQVNAAQPEVFGQRMRIFMQAMRERAQGLPAKELTQAQSSLATLGNLVELLVVARLGVAPPEFEPLLIQEEYSLDDLLALQGQLRALEDQREQTELQVEQGTRQLRLLQERRDRLQRDYESSALESPARILTGIRRVAARVELDLAEAASAYHADKLEAISSQTKLVQDQITFARAHLVSSADATADLDERMARAEARASELANRVTAQQSQLLDALSDEQPNASLEQLRKQQLTRSSAELELARLQVSLEKVRSDWHRLRAGELEFDVNPRAMAEARRAVEQAEAQVEVWLSASEATLVSAPADSKLNSAKNHELALTAARETLELGQRIYEAGDDLLLLTAVLSAEQVSAQSGLARFIGRLSLFVGDFWNRVAQVADYHLVEIGETPLTPGSLFKMVLILVVAWLISWGIRHAMSSGLGGTEQLIRSPALYTLSRVLHYLVITIGLFAALSSIGIDFTSFALIAGALSVGIGFGLQAIVNNFVSGLILLFEGTLRVGDHIELQGGLAGQVVEINSRATIINTTDGVDVVVPNSELATTQLTNWTLRESVARMRLPFGVAHGSDKLKVREAALAAAAETEFAILDMPGREPQVRLVNLGENALEFMVMLWVSRAGVRRPHRVRASFLWALETKLREAGIEIPFPQRDIHIRSDFRRAPAPVNQAESGLEP